MPNHKLLGKKQNHLNKSKSNLCWLNVGSEYEVSIRELADLISKIIGFKGKIIWDNEKPDGTPRKRLNNDHIFSLGWKPKITLDEGIKKTIEELKLKLLK